MKWWGFILFISLISCSDEREIVDKPKNLIPEDTMVMALRDMTLIESHIQMKYEGVTVYKELMERSGEKVLRSYKLSPERFERSMAYYGSRQDLMQQLYSRVLDSLNLMSGKIGIEKQQGSSEEVIVPDFLKMDKEVK